MQPYFHIGAAAYQPPRTSDQPPRTSATGKPPLRFLSYSAFTLIELLVVISIIGILAAIGLPALKGLGQSNTLMAAQRQMLDDLALARLHAINQRSTVYVVFIPPGISVHNQWVTRPNEKKQFLNLLKGQYTSYALFTRRSVGEQPGRENFRYLTEWKSLPDGVLVLPKKFEVVARASWLNFIDPKTRPFAYNDVADFPFPSSVSARARLPYIAFNSLGQLATGREEVIPLARGSILSPKDPLTTPLDVVVTQTNYSYVRINWLTGRAKVDKLEIK